MLPYFWIAKYIAADKLPQIVVTEFGVERYLFKIDCADGRSKLFEGNWNVWVIIRHHIKMFFVLSSKRPRRVTQQIQSSLDRA